MLQSLWRDGAETKALALRTPVWPWFDSALDAIRGTLLCSVYSGFISCLTIAKTKFFLDLV